MADRIKFVVEFDAAAATAQLDEFKRKAGEAGGSVSGGGAAGGGGAGGGASGLGTLGALISNDILNALRSQIPNMFDPLQTARQKEASAIHVGGDVVGGIIGGAIGSLAGPGGTVAGALIGSKVGGTIADSFLASNKEGEVVNEFVRSRVAQENAGRVDIGLAPLQGAELRDFVRAFERYARERFGAELGGVAGANLTATGLMNGRATDMGTASGRDMLSQVTRGRDE